MYIKKGMHKSLSFVIILIIVSIFLSTSSNTILAQTSDNPFSVSDKEHSEKLIKAKYVPDKNDYSISLYDYAQKDNDILLHEGKSYIVKFKEDVLMQQIYDTIKYYEYEIISKSEHRLFVVETVNIQELEQNTSDIIEYIEEDVKKESHIVPSDTYYTYQWALPATNILDAWNITKGSNSIYVAVIDSGICRDHPDLIGADIRNGWDYIFDENCDWDSVGHGTSVTGIIGAQTNNYEGIAGVNWNVAIIPLRVVYSDGTIYTSDTIEAIYDAADIGCKIINLSLGSSTFSSAEYSAISYAISHGCIVIASAGNDGNSAYNYPASYSDVVSVGSIDSSLNHSYFSQINNRIDVVAPGQDILTTTDYTKDGYDYNFVDGTSFSAPYVSGIASLVAAVKPSISPQEFSDLLKVTSMDLGSEGFDNYYGYGLIDAKKILNYIAGYNVIYNDNASSSGTVPVDGNTYMEGESVSVMDNSSSLIKDGYIFIGWNTMADGSGITYKPGETFIIGNHDETLYAQWKETEPIINFITRYYNLCLNRQPDASGLEYWLNSLAYGYLTGADVARQFIMSPEFKERGVTDDEFINIMYETFFNRGADSGGKEYWQSQLKNGISRLFILSGFVDSEEFSNVCSSYGITRGNITLTDPADIHPEVTIFVNRFYVLCLDRRADEEGLNYWVGNLINGINTGAQISGGFIFSQEFTDKNLSNEDYISVMYRVFFNREPDTGGVTYWVGILDAGTTKLDVLRGFVASAEFAQICRSYGIIVGTI